MRPFLVVVLACLFGLGCDRAEKDPVHASRGPSSSGRLRIEFPEQEGDQPVSVSWPGGEVWPKRMPAELSVPLEREVTIWVGRQSGSFQQKLTLSAAAPSATVVVPLRRPAPLGLFGFRRDELAAPSGFQRVEPRRVSVAPLLLELGAWNRGRSVTLFGIDAAGNVVQVRSTDAGSDHELLGRVDAGTLKMRLDAARRAAVRAREVRGVACNDCGNAAILVTSDTGEQRLTLATDGELCSRVSDPGGVGVVRWFLAVALETGRRFWGTY